jgi:transcriptional regulator with XRE-family HTH domain
MEELYGPWGARVAERRAELGISQRKLAEKVGVSQSAINHLERGRSSPSDGLRMRLAGVLRCRVEQLFPYPEVTTRGEPK